MPYVTDIQVLKEIATRIRIHSVESTSNVNSGHPTTSSSIAEILSVLFFNTMRYTTQTPKDPSNDRFILSKGHAAPALYGAWVENGVVQQDELVKKLRQVDSNLEGHPTPRLNFIDVGTGSLGQGLSIAAGMGYILKNFDKTDTRVFCLVGDGECAEGSIWEAIAFISYYKLDNIILVIDANRLGQSEATSIGHDLLRYKKRLEAFDWQASIVDGHKVEELVKAFDEAIASRSTRPGVPCAIIAKTFKGREFPGIEDQDGWHGKPLNQETERVLKYLRSLLKFKGNLKYTIPAPQSHPPQISIKNIKLSSPPNYKLGDSVPTRKAYGTALVKLAKNNPRVIALDGDMKNSTHSEQLKHYDPAKYIECFIAEQNMVGVAIGATCRDRAVAFVSTFAAFLTRAYDQIRMGAISRTNVNFVGTHCGVTVGEDGTSQMGLEDISMFRSLPDSTVFYPADVVAAERAVELAANTAGICYIRLNRPATKIVYNNNHVFEIGKANVLISSTTDQVLLIAAGVTLQEAVTAINQLATVKINVRLLDLFTIKPIDQQAIISNAKECGGRILVVEDHYPEGGIGEAVLAAVAEERDIYVKKVAIPKLPRSGTVESLLDYYGLSAKYIVKYVQEIIKK